MYIYTASASIQLYVYTIKTVHCYYNKTLCYSRSMNDDVMMMFSSLNEYKYMYIPHSIWNKKIKFNYVTYDAEDVVRCIRA